MTVIATDGQASAASRIIAGGPMPITCATSLSENTAGAISTQSPCAAQMPSSTWGWYVIVAPLDAIGGEFDLRAQARQRARTADRQSGDGCSSAKDQRLEVAPGRIAVDPDLVSAARIADQLNAQTVLVSPERWEGGRRAGEAEDRSRHLRSLPGRRLPLLAALIRAGH